LHLLVVFLHLVLLHVTPVAVDFLLDLSLSVLELLLGLLLVVDVTHHHLRLKGFNLILSFMHVLVSLSELLITKLILVVGLFGINTAPFDLNKGNKHEIAVRKHYHTGHLPPHPQVF
jgi:hypothetical protein